MFHAQDTSFLVVTAPNRPSVDVARFFIDELQSRNMPSVGVLVNQCHRILGRPLEPQAVLGEVAKVESEGLARHTAGALLARLGAAHRRLSELTAIEGELIEELQGATPASQSVWTVPRLAGEVHDLPALGRVGDHLFGAIAPKDS